MVEGKKGIVTVSSNPKAAQAGIEVLNKGGSAADAAVAAALVQNVFAAGSNMSVAGIYTMLYYSAVDKKTYSLDATFTVPKNERDPMSIPEQFEGAPNGRKIVVPGFIAGVEATNKRFGKLPLKDLVEPAVRFAQDGIEINEKLAINIQTYEDAIRRCDELKTMFVKESGELCRAGDMIKQPELAATLGQFAANGSDYFYRGEWAEKLVSKVRGFGGTLTMEDMGEYHVDWRGTVSSTFRDFVLLGMPAPNTGSRITFFILKMLEEGNVSKYGHYTENADAFRWTWEATCSYTPFVDEMFGLLTQDDKRQLFDGKDITLDNCLETETLQHIWRLIKQNKFSYLAKENPSNTGSVVVIDREGNMAVLVHSSCVNGWEEGIIVQGVAIPNFGGRLKVFLKNAGAGNKTGSVFNPIIVMKDKKPYIGSVSINASLYEKSSIALYNMLEFGMDLQQAQNMPNPLYSDTAEMINAEYIIEKDFKKKLLDELKSKGIIIMDAGQNSLLKQAAFSGYDRIDGLWVAAQADYEAGCNRGISCKYYDGVAMAE